MGRRQSRQRSGTPALRALQQAGVAHTAHAYDHDPSADAGYGEEAAAVLGLDPARVFKTLVAQVDADLVVAVVPVADQLDLKALAKAIGGKRAAMADPAAAERATGYVVGGISPLGQRQRLRTVVDATAAGHRTIYVSGGRRGLDVEVAPGDLMSLTGAVSADVRRGRDKA